jgi:hypothetical protein
MTTMRILLVSALCSACVVDTSADDRPDAATAGDSLALGGWSVTVDLAECELEPRTIAFWLDQDVAGVATVSGELPIFEGAGVHLGATGARVRLYLAGSETWALVLGDDGVTASGAVIWEGPSPVSSKCETQGPTTITNRVRPTP